MRPSWRLKRRPASPVSDWKHKAAVVPLPNRLRRRVLRVRQRACSRGLRRYSDATGHMDRVDDLSSGHSLETVLAGFAQVEWYCRAGVVGYTHGMKTAISLPDAVFRAAERQAKRSKKSRSQLYADALAEYLSRHAPEEVTEAMNRVVDQIQESRDPFVLAAARSVLERVEW
jgi:hypothetical protein